MKNIISKSILSVILFCLLLFVFSCNDNTSNTPKDPVLLKIAVVSDLHFYDPSLGVSGEEFEKYLAGDRKMIAESQAISNSALNTIASLPSNIVLIPGDLTKDGEKVSHEMIAGLLAQLEAKGKKVFVIPGNHDILNPHSYKYLPSGGKQKIDHISAAQFAEIYKNFGFNEAKYRDNNSLSYIVELNSNFWLFAIDGCIYENNLSQDHSTTGGRISSATLTWLKEKLAEAKSKNIMPIAMAHHGLVDHFPGQALVFAEYLFTDYLNLQKELANAGLKIIFTGHHHAQDISKADISSSFIFDVQTGSTVTYPCPIRYVEIDKDKQTVNIESQKITAIEYNLGGKSFQEYALNKLLDGFPALVIAQLKQLGADETSAALLEPIVTQSLVAYYQGDEPKQITPAVTQTINQLKAYPDNNVKLIASLLEGIWNDPTPDNSVLIDLKTGTITDKNTK